MPRLARVIASKLPHHVTQRGNRRMQTFFCDGDYRAYVALMAEWCRKSGVEIWAYCLMPNHVHMIAVPETEEALRRGIGEAHRRYSRMINFREGWRGHLWQGRFASFPMDEQYLLAAARYIEMNPVRAQLVDDPAMWPWSSASAHFAGEDDVLVKAKPLLEIAGNWEHFLSLDDAEADKLRLHERTGRPLGNETFVDSVEVALARPIRRKKPGPKPKRA